VNLAVGVRTDVGQVREGNEDSYLADSPVFVVADGMGGHLAGDVASATAIEVIQRDIAEVTEAEPDKLVAVLKNANAVIYGKAKDDESVRGMGTTCTLLVIEDSNAQLAHVGDSRAYLLRGGELRQVTEDHTLVGRMVSEGRIQPEEAQHHPQRSIITRALGVDSEVDVDLISLPLQEGDRLLLCSDGLTSMVEAGEIQDCLAAGGDPQQIADELVTKANDAGGDDNITVIVVFAGVAESMPAPVQKASTADLGPREETDPAADTGYHRAVEVTSTKRRWTRKLVAALAVVALLAVGGYGAARYALSNSWFVGVNDEGRVTIYRGIPDEIAGLSLKEEHDTSSVRLEALPDFKRDEVAGGIRVGSLSEAEETVEDLERLARDEEFTFAVPPGEAA